MSVLQPVAFCLNTPSVLSLYTYLQRRRQPPVLLAQFLQLLASASARVPA